MDGTQATTTTFAASRAALAKKLTQMATVTTRLWLSTSPASSQSPTPVFGPAGGGGGGTAASRSGEGGEDEGGQGGEGGDGGDDGDDDDDDCALVGRASAASERSSGVVSLGGEVEDDDDSSVPLAGLRALKMSRGVRRSVLDARVAVVGTLPYGSSGTVRSGSRGGGSGWAEEEEEEAAAPSAGMPTGTAPAVEGVAARASTTAPEPGGPDPGSYSLRMSCGRDESRRLSIKRYCWTSLFVRS
jgi:hypothetical protein